MIIFGAIWAQTPFFGLFYLKSYDDEIWYVGTLCDLEYECPNRISIFGLGPFFWREPRFSDFLVCSKTKSRIICPPNILLAVGELFVRVRSARSQARSACVIARRRRVSIRPKAEGFARRRRALCSGAKRP